MPYMAERRGYLESRAQPNPVCLVPGVIRSVNSSLPTGYPLLNGKTSYHQISRLKSRYMSSEISYRSDIWQAPRQQCCRGACQISERYDHFNTQSRSFETSRGFPCANRSVTPSLPLGCGWLRREEMPPPPHISPMDSGSPGQCLRSMDKWGIRIFSITLCARPPSTSSTQICFVFVFCISNSLVTHDFNTCLHSCIKIPLPIMVAKIDFITPINVSIGRQWYVIVFLFHYNDVIMGTIASQIINLTIVYSTVYSDADQRKHQSSASLAFLRGFHRGPVNSPHKWPITRKMFPFDDVIMS